MIRFESTDRGMYTIYFGEGYTTYITIFNDWVYRASFDILSAYIKIGGIGRGFSFGIALLGFSVHFSYEMPRRAQEKA